mmetsp:Transcript_7157/g.11881  ORF Transcript_7157/g.11881 Transcript_7157/m.11881 type:complete len:109 (+) Transcript_7157:190-516(+)|eukprot:CAMPEP_0119022440 /NCGR_PEP_ID=MMETSP1176-20130426/28028_1 /TAXON_ID=265551 /ORGANISM="Synedropsis recta cf, Strain CCMP1620" /LENGTH=108 /DNA_ID=CAMNT_0006977301 /DNA_START=181 /DNA_END=507 /DNA_ORIENTATION=+
MAPINTQTESHSALLTENELQSIEHFSDLYNSCSDASTSSTTTCSSVASSLSRRAKNAFGKLARQRNKDKRSNRKRPTKYCREHRDSFELIRRESVEYLQRPAHPALR